MHVSCFRKVSTVVTALALAACCALPALAAARKIERRVAPFYPELAKRMHIAGTVRVAATIAADGAVTKVKAISGNKLLEPAAENAIRRWKFAPGDGPSTENIDIDFVESE